MKNADGLYLDVATGEFPQALVDPSIKWQLLLDQAGRRG